eukprot:2890502-Pleurochrysis_carterae.AAC.1
MKGFEEYDKMTRERLVCKLKMALEGGRQSGYLWQQANTEFLKGFWNDDLAIAYANKDEKLFGHFAKACGNRFKSKISNQVDKFIGLK